MVQSSDDKIYSWGRGHYGVLGNASNQYSLTPMLNEEVEALKEEDPTRKIKKLDSSDEFTGLLFNTGELFVWGKNDRGQLGVGHGVGIDMVESENVPTLVGDANHEMIEVSNFNTG